jgi:hypothetical protein
MKKILNKHIHFSLMFSLTAICILFASCKSEEITSPVITSVRMYNASPMDTLMSVGNSKTDTLWSGRTGKYVTIIGQNLQNALSIKFNGVATKFNSALFAPNSVVVPIPDIMFSTIDTTKLYTLEYETTTGSTTFSFKLGPQAPTIKAISNVFANPGDSVYIYGTNLVLVQSFSYGGTKITSFKPNLYGTALGFKMPSPAPTTGQVVITTKTGTSNLKILALPTIAGISNENASAGDSVYIFGTYLKSIQSFTYAGTSITSFVSSANGSYVGFKLPTLTTQSGPVSITTAFGTTTIPYNINTLNYLQDGVIMNFDGNLWTFSGMEGSWGNDIKGGINNAANDRYGWFTHTTDFDGVLGTNNTQFPFYRQDAVFDAGQGGSDWNGHAFQIAENQWIPTGNLSDPVDSWAIKFEMSIAKPLNGVSICIRTDFAGDSYLFRYEPWQISASTTKNFSTKGWITVTVPLTEFRAKDDKLGLGRGASVSSLTKLVDNNGKTKLKIFAKNFGATKSATGFYGAFDNIRVVKIK